STISTLNPASAASRAIAAPLIPAPITISSYERSSAAVSIDALTTRRPTSKAVSMRDSPFGSVGARDGAHAAYRDVLAAVPKGLSRSGTAPATSRSAGNHFSRADLAGAADDVFVARELGGADRPARVDLARRDADLRTHAEFAAVGELRRRVVHD